MTSAFKVFLVMLAVPVAYIGFSTVFGSALSLWGAVFAAGFLGIAWFHRARTRGLYMPYIILWAMFFGGMYYASTSAYCDSGGRVAQLSAMLCPFPR